MSSPLQEGSWLSNHCCDLGGIYVALRAAVQSRYRWNNVREMCRRYLQLVSGALERLVLFALLLEVSFSSGFDGFLGFWYLGVILGENFGIFVVPSWGLQCFLWLCSSGFLPYQKTYVLCHCPRRLECQSKKGREVPELIGWCPSIECLRFSNQSPLGKETFSSQKLCSWVWRL